MQRITPWKSYQHVATETASPGQLVLMLYDGTLRFLEQARRGLQADDPSERNQAVNNNLLRAQAILGELNASLDLKRGGELAATLRRLYEYFEGRLMESNLNKEESGIREVIERMTTLREAWATMLRGYNVGQGAEETAALCALG